ncbi:hypothetical protein EV356DRAFT_500409 [Viridothelium virens]|uniref:Core domain-containing protein n=1 Tax=Viridothelium virens TaxID=1048519 RepID=A0A6A6HDC6_VIRVR|nr:hypothetical protein EV356DRAFT_500409 [Viridothelium virens]
MNFSPVICASCKAVLRQSLRRTTEGPIRRYRFLRNLTTRPQIISSNHCLFTRAFRAPLPEIPQGVGLRRRNSTTLGLSRQERHTRPLSSSARRREAIINPRKDEDGNSMEIQITPRAENRLKQIMTNDSNPNLCLRVSVESGGCHGFQYLMSLTNTDQISHEDDTVFQGPEGAKVVMDEPSLELLKGSKVDYTMELIGSQFKIVDNPLATSSCGCGTSFDIKA